LISPRRRGREGGASLAQMQSIGRRAGTH